MKLLSPGRWADRDGALQLQMNKDEFLTWKIGKEYTTLLKSEGPRTTMHFLLVQGQPVLVYEVKGEEPSA